MVGIFRMAFSTLLLLVTEIHYTANIYLSTSTIETPEKGVKYVHVVLLFLLLTLNIFLSFFSVSIVNFRQVSIYINNKKSQLK